MKKLIPFLVMSGCLFAQDVVINEVLYDPAGPDTGFEWIELYNYSDFAIDLQNWKLQKAGTSFVDVFTFPSILIEAHGFLLIGEANVPNTDLTASLAFQNGGAETDGIRLVSADELYTDTVLYDSPNTNGLPDDNSSPGLYFAPDVAAGNTLARKHDGEDTNNCELDFFECVAPTPGSANFYPVDLAIYSLEISLIANEFWLQTEVFNLSTENVDNGEASLEITINSGSYISYALSAIPASGSLLFSGSLGFLQDSYVVVQAELYYLFDNQLDNNFAAASILCGASPIILNEIMFKPLSANQEWIELFNRSACGYLVDNWRIVDASGGQIRFSGVIEANQFYVVCQNPDLMLQIYPEINPDRIIQSYSWTVLNNTTETLILKDDCTAVFDSVYYNGGSCPSDYSIERVNPYSDENIQWLVCLDSLGGTPTLPNSVLPVSKDMELLFIDHWQEDGNILHRLLLKNLGLENIETAELNIYCNRYDDDEYNLIYSSVLSLSDSLEIIVMTELPPVGYYSFLYQVESVEDLNEINNTDISFFNHASLPFVINEIMYAPETGLPEWVEIKNNFPVPELQKFYLAADNDTICRSFCQDEYFLITSNAAAADTLRQLFDLSGIEILLGLPNLSNSGEQLTLLDGFGNLIETFFYLPAWNLNQKGVSIERVNSALPALEGNWGPSVTQCTPGSQNSIFVQVLPSQMKLSVAPNPFSPYRGEHTIFSFKLPEILSRVTLRVFDLKGRMLCKLVNQQLQAAEGNLVWNGKGDNGKNLPVGVYIVLMEAVSCESEKVYKKKITVVIGK